MVLFHLSVSVSQDLSIFVCVFLFSFVVVVTVDAAAAAAFFIGWRGWGANEKSRYPHRPSAEYTR